MRMLSIYDFVKENPSFSVSGIRWLRHKAVHNLNEYQKAFLNIGRRVYVDPEEFFKITYKLNGINKK